MRPSRVAGAAPLALAMAALLAACAVDLNGAPCSTPFGETNNCPGGQACGNDHRCSERALACATSRCDPDPAVSACDSGKAQRCTEDDPVCGTKVIEDCTEKGFECGKRSGVAACECPLTTTRAIAVQPGGSDAGAPRYPTGMTMPPECSFRKLSDALEAAAEAIAGEPTAVATVTAMGAQEGTKRSFSRAKGEVFPLVVPARVTLASDAPISRGTYEIVFDGVNPTTVTAPIELHSGGALAGFTVSNGNGDATRDAIALRCDGSTDPATLTSVVLEGMGSASALGRGVLIDGTCGLAATDHTQVQNFSTAGVVLNSAAGAQFALTGGGSVSGCGDGVFLRNGRLLLDSSRISKNNGMGVRADDFSGMPRVEIRGSQVSNNGDTGIALISASEVRITGTAVFKNGAATSCTDSTAHLNCSWGGPPLSASRKAGGIVLWGTPPASGSFEFARNRVYANSGDQVLVLGTTSTWALDGSGCGSDPSAYTVVGCYDPTPAGTTVPYVGYRGVVAVDAFVSATNLGWPTLTPSATSDVWKFGTGAVTFNPWCQPDPIVNLSCPP